jgi:hypothetical protein
MHRNRIYLWPRNCWAVCISGPISLASLFENRSSIYWNWREKVDLQLWYYAFRHLRPLRRSYSLLNINLKICVIQTRILWLSSIVSCSCGTFEKIKILKKGKCVAELPELFRVKCASHRYAADTNSTHFKRNNSLVCRVSTRCNHGSTGSKQVYLARRRVYSRTTAHQLLIHRILNIITNRFKFKVINKHCLKRQAKHACQVHSGRKN